MTLVPSAASAKWLKVALGSIAILAFGMLSGCCHRELVECPPPPAYGRFIGFQKSDLDTLLVTRISRSESSAGAAITETFYLTEDDLNAVGDTLFIRSNTAGTFSFGMD